FSSFNAPGSPRITSPKGPKIRPHQKAPRFAPPQMGLGRPLRAGDGRNDLGVNGTFGELPVAAPPLAPGREEDGGGPGGDEVPEGYELRDERRQEGPVPPDEPCHQTRDRDVERVVPG